MRGAFGLLLCWLDMDSVPERFLDDVFWPETPRFPVAPPGLLVEDLETTLGDPIAEDPYVPMVFLSLHLLHCPPPVPLLPTRPVFFLELLRSG